MTRPICTPLIRTGVPCVTPGARGKRTKTVYVPTPGQGQIAEPRHQKRGDQRCGQNHNADSKAKYAIVHRVQVQFKFVSDR